MVKSVLVTLTIDIPDNQLSQAGKVVIGTTEYPGTVTAIIVHEAAAQAPAVSKVTIQAPGLGIVPP